MGTFFSSRFGYCKTSTFPLIKCSLGCWNNNVGFALQKGPNWKEKKKGKKNNKINNTRIRRKILKYNLEMQATPIYD